MRFYVVDVGTYREWVRASTSAKAKANVVQRFWRANGHAPIKAIVRRVSKREWDRI